MKKNQPFCELYKIQARNLEEEERQGITPKNLLQCEAKKMGEGNDLLSTLKLRVVIDQGAMKNVVIDAVIVQEINLEPGETVPLETSEEKGYFYFPLIEMAKRLIRETTEIIFDEEGIELEF